MQKIVLIFSFLLVNNIVFSQKRTTTKKAKDTLKTEVINVITSYSPTISDAFKIKKNPTVKEKLKSKKEKLEYKIFSVPVASTFIPRSGTFRGVNTGRKERIYKNYIATGFGNNTTPFFEMFLSHKTRSKTNFGLYGKYISSENFVKNAPLDNGFSNAIIGVFYKQEKRDFNWTAGADFKRNKYNWYGLPDHISFTENTINTINETQVYTDFNAKGEVVFEDFYLKSGEIDFSYFSDKLNSQEFRFSVKPLFQLLSSDSGIKFNKISVNSSIEYLGGKFTKTYENNATLKHSFFTLGVLPKYSLGSKYFNMKLGAKLYFTSDIENKINLFFAYPDINITLAVLVDYINIYIGADGGLKTNSYEDFISENPYLSPTQFITQTNKKYNLFVGLIGKLSSNIDYHFKASYSDEDDKALFVRNNSKFDGSNSNSLLGYEFGNSFSVVYDDVKTFSISGKLTIDLFKNLIIGTAGEFNLFKLTNQTEAWNLPNITAEVFGNYKIDKWYVGTNLFFVGERKDLADGSVFPPTRGQQILKSYVDLNLNGGYYFNDKFTAFLKLNNVLNSDYQRYANFTVQGFQVLGGISYKFDF